jgi:phosphoenolpyruvate phosphomutase
MSAQSRPARLRALLGSAQTEFMLEAHSGISARVAEEAGFRGIWASGLAMSALCGVRDNNELSASQVLQIVEFMADVTSVPILVDGDTGYGDFNSTRRFVRKLEQYGIAGVCLEDKLFPKTNSFIEGDRQPLADVEEFCGKLRAARDSVLDRDFCVVARIEALIAGFGVDTALERADAYRRAGADAILIHSKRNHADEILAFARAWADALPLVIVPTKYYRTPTDVFRRAGIRIVIWANHMLRAAVGAMQGVARSLQQSQTLVEVEQRVAPLEEIFRLQGADELLAAERRYRMCRPRPGAIVLGASRGPGLEPLTDQRPKVMLPVAGKPLLRRLVDRLKVEGVHDIAVVAGYRAEAIDPSGIRVIRNPSFAQGGELGSLRCAREQLGADTIVLYGDLLFRSYILQDLLESTADVTVVVDSAPPSERGGTRSWDLAYCSAPDDRGWYRPCVQLEAIRATPSADRAPDGRWIGMLRVQGAGRAALLRALDEVTAPPDAAEPGLPDLLNAMIAAGQAVHVIYIHGHWLDVNDLIDLERAQAFAHAEMNGEGGRA